MTASGRQRAGTTAAGDSSSGRWPRPASDGCVVIADERSTANLRWAGNTLTTNGVIALPPAHRDRDQPAAAGPRVGVVSRAGVRDDQVEDVVRAAEQAAADGAPGRGRRSRWSGRATMRCRTISPARATGTSRAEHRDRRVRRVRPGARRGVRRRAQAGARSCSASPSTR